MIGTFSEKRKDGGSSFKALHDYMLYEVDRETGEFIERGELVALLPEFVPAPMPVSLLYAQQLHVPLRVQAFMAWLTQLLAAPLDL